MRILMRLVLAAIAVVTSVGLACNTSVGDQEAGAADQSVKVIANFEDSNPFGGGSVVEGRAPEGRRALRIDKSYASMEQRQNWLGYDYLKVELDSAASVPMILTIEIRDASTTGYWTRVNFETVAPPGAVP